MKTFCDTASTAVSKLKSAGIDAECYACNNDTTEITIDNSDFSLIRTYEKCQLTLTGYKDGRMLSSTVSNPDRDSVNDAVESIKRGIATANKDELYCVNPIAEHRSFTRNAQGCDYDAFFKRLHEYTDWYMDKNDGKQLDEFIANYTRKKTVYINSNGAELTGDQAYYNLEGTISGLYAADLSRPLQKLGYFALPYDRNMLNEKPRPIGDKFVGTLIYTPRGVRHEWWHALCFFHTKEMLAGDMAKSYRWNDKIGKQVAVPELNVANTPCDVEFSGAPFFSCEGVIASDLDIIVDGKLVNYPASRYTAAKLGIAPNMPPAEEQNVDDNVLKLNVNIRPGASSIVDIIKNVERGIIVTSGMPGWVPAGDPDGAINSIVRDALLIEDGVITRPVSEIMIAGNYYDKFMNIRGISKELRLSGGDRTPWIAYDGFTIQ